MHKNIILYATNSLPAKLIGMGFFCVNVIYKLLYDHQCVKPEYKQFCL